MRKVWLIAQKDLYATYTDRNLLLIMIALPLAIASIIALAFGGGGESTTIRDIPIVVVNLDNGDNGDLFVNILRPDLSFQPSSRLDVSQTCDATSTTTEPTLTLDELFATEIMTDAEQARLAVARGEYALAVILPPTFSASLDYFTPAPTPDTIMLYTDPAQATSAEIASGVITGMINQLNTGNIAIASTINTLIDRIPDDPSFGINFLLLQAARAFSPNFACAFDPSFNTLQIERQNNEGFEILFTPLAYFSAGQAMFFMLFTAQGGANSILEDRREWFLQRMIVSPTSRLTILLGKFLGTWITCFAQLILLVVGFGIAGTLINGEITFVWGTNFPLILVVMLSASLAASGLGSILAAVAKTPEQSSIVGTTLNIAMGIVGGAFVAVFGLPWIRSIQWFSLVYWGADAFTKLSIGDHQVWLNVGILTLQGAVMFLVGLFIFNRRLDI